MSILPVLQGRFRRAITGLADDIDELLDLNDQRLLHLVADDSTRECANTAILRHTNYPPSVS